jgi:hypothetical protein
MSSRFCAVSSTAAAIESSGSDLILPCQYHDVSGGHRLSGEQRLMLALLTDAINVYQKGVLSHVTRARRLYVDAERWILADDDTGEWLSFTTVCDALGIDAPHLRRRIISWKHEIQQRRRPHPAFARTHLRITPRADRVGHARPAPQPAARAS